MPRRLTIWLARSFLLCALALLPLPGAAQTMEAPPPLPEGSLTCPPQDVPPVPGALLRSLVTLFTGPGLHPTAAIVVPDGGAAGGLALNVDWNSSEPIQQRFATSIKERATA